MSIIVLVYSIVNNNARYAERISSVQIGLNTMKSLKRQLGVDRDLATVRQEYENVVNSIEIRDDIDFYFTVCHLCKQYSISRFTGKDKKNTLPLPPSEIESLREIQSEIRGYISEINPYIQEININLIRIWHVSLYAIPIFIFGICIFSNTLC